MRASANVRALKMAVKENRAPEIHHSDRVSQYTYKGYTDLLEQSCKDQYGAISSGKCLC